MPKDTIEFEIRMHRKVDWFEICCRKKPKQPMESFDVICLGLAGAGKTTLLCILSKQTTDDITPTTGFMIKACQMDSCIINVKEVGGGSEMRQYWKHYYKHCQALVFVVDSASEREELETAGRALEGALKHPDLQGVPCLIVANYQDKVGARNESQLQEVLKLESICSGRHWILSLCSMNDYDAIYAAFSKLALYLKNPDDSV